MELLEMMVLSPSPSFVNYYEGWWAFQFSRSLEL
jgi:hypothetical protein